MSDLANTTDYDAAIATAVGEHLRPIISQYPDGSLVPALTGIPAFLEAVHNIVADKLA